MAGQLTIEEREQIAHFRSQGLSRSKIAERLGRHRSTIGRELGRNSDGATYWASIAQGKALARRRQRRKKLDDPELNEYVRVGLVKRWSPEQIAGRLLHERQRKLSHMTIYR